MQDTGQKKSRRVTRKTIKGTTQVIFSSLPWDIQQTHPDFDVYTLAPNQWWEAIKIHRKNYLSWGSRNITMIRKATKEEVKYYRSPELIRVKL